MFASELGQISPAAWSGPCRALAPEWPCRPQSPDALHYISGRHSPDHCACWPLPPAFVADPPRRKYLLQRLVAASRPVGEWPRISVVTLCQNYLARNRSRNRRHGLENSRPCAHSDGLSSLRMCLTVLSCGVAGRLLSRQFSHCLSQFECLSLRYLRYWLLRLPPQPEGALRASYTNPAFVVWDARRIRPFLLAESQLCHLSTGNLLLEDFSH
jgi:hypothetical protein